MEEDKKNRWYNTSFSTVDKYRAYIGLFTISIIAIFWVLFILDVLLEIIDLSESIVLILTLTAFICATISATILVVKPKRDVSTFDIENLFEITERQLGIQAFLSVVLMIVIGGTVIYFSNSLIYTATETKSESAVASQLNKNIQNLKDERAKLYAFNEEALRAEIATNFEAIKNIEEKNRVRIIEINTEIKELNFQLLTKIESQDDISDANGIKKSFLFEYFSMLIARLGTISILLFVFGIAFSHYRRSIQRLNRYRELIISYAMTKENFDHSTFGKIIPLTEIEESNVKLDKASGELAYQETFFSHLKDFMDKMPKNEENKS